MAKPNLRNFSVGPFKGMNNRLPRRDMPADVLANAVNVLVDNSGKAIFPAIGKTQVYSGTNVHSIKEFLDVTLFVDNGILKKLNSNYTATTILAGVGSSPMFYEELGDHVYFSNSILMGRYSKTLQIYEPWGIDRPAFQPSCEASSFGGLPAGEYRVAITWVGAWESGTTTGRKVALLDGQGIRLYNFPTPPSNAEVMRVYVTATNSKEYYLFWEYPVGATDITITKLNPQGVVPTIPLKTMYHYTPLVRGKFVVHSGRIYYTRKNRVFFTEPKNYGLAKPLQYWTFDGEIKALYSIPPLLFVHTDKTLYQITNIDLDGAPVIRKSVSYGATPNTEVPDQTIDAGYTFTKHGFLMVDNQGSSKELSYKDNALPLFSKGTMSIVEKDGMKFLLFFGRGGTQNPLADKEYNSTELARGSL